MTPWKRTQRTGFCRSSIPNLSRHLTMTSLWLVEDLAGLLLPRYHLMYMCIAVHVHCWTLSLCSYHCFSVGWCLHFCLFSLFSICTAFFPSPTFTFVSFAEQSLTGIVCLKKKQCVCLSFFSPHATIFIVVCLFLWWRQFFKEEDILMNMADLVEEEDILMNVADLAFWHSTVRLYSVCVCVWRCKVKTMGKGNLFLSGAHEPGVNLCHQS